MGCALTKEKLESEMLLIQLERIKIRDERNLIINQLQNVTGEKYKRKKIPDFIDHEAMKKIKQNKKKSSKIILKQNSRNSNTKTSLQNTKRFSQSISDVND
jgi:hypothetical protein